MPDRIKDETEIVQIFLAPLAAGMPGAFGLGDDAAVLSHPPGTDLVVSNDPVIAGVHFFPDDEARDIAWKALAVNVSDLVAKGAKPIAYTMALAFPEVPSKSWMTGFARGLDTAQRAFGCGLIGGDTDVTPGPLSIGITAFGLVEHNKIILRRGAVAGDHVFVTGTIGDSALGLLLQGGSQKMTVSESDKDFLMSRYLRPIPRVEFIDTLRLYARSALDVSDGLVKDLARLVGENGLVLRVNDVPLSFAASAVLGADPSVLRLVLTGGCDYEVLFAVPPGNVAMMRKSAAEAKINVAELGILSSTTRGLSVVDAAGAEVLLPQSGYDHFSRL